MGRRIGVIEVVAGVMLVLTLVPTSCHVSAGSTAYHTDDGGPLVFGVLAVVLAAVALIRRRRDGLGAPGVAMLVIAALGGVQIVRGAGSLERVETTVDLRAPVRQVLDGLADDRFAALIESAEPELRQDAATLGHWAHAITRGLGHVKDVGALETTTGAGGLAQATTDARFERGVLHAEITFRMRDGAAHLVGMHFVATPDPAPDDPAGAEAAARAAASHLLAGDLASFHADLDPRVELTADFDAKARTFADAIGASPQLAVERTTTTCHDGETCFDIKVEGAHAYGQLHVGVSRQLGVWLVTTVTF